jgi:hypothetical protein
MTNSGEGDAGAAETEQTARVLEAIRHADDLDRPWPVNDLVEALRLPTMTGKALKRHFESAECPAVSLRCMMDLAVSDAPDPRAGYMVAPLLDLCCVGQKGFWSMVNRFTELDLGTAGSRYWQQKLVILRRSWRVKGARRYSWSKPLVDLGTTARSGPTRKRGP